MSTELKSMEDEIAKLFKSDFYGGHEFDVKVARNSDGSITVEVFDMYQAPVRLAGLLDTLQAISRITGKPEVNEGDTISEPGCETCDYYSRYGFTFHAFD